MNQTAVQWLHRESKELIGMFLDGEIDKRLLLTMHHNSYYKAEKMEQEQILESWKEGYDLAINGKIPKL